MMAGKSNENMWLLWISDVLTENAQLFAQWACAKQRHTSQKYAELAIQFPDATENWVPVCGIRIDGR